MIQAKVRVVFLTFSSLFLVVQSSFSASTHVEDLTFRMYRSLLKSKESANLVFSPYAIRQALGVAAVGAKGKTLKQLGKAPDQLPVKKNPSYKLFLANRIWVQNGFPILETYQNLSDKNFGVRPWVVDFSRAPDFVRDRVNGWVLEKTMGEIPDLISEAAVDSSMRMLLGSALYFKGDWVTQFDEKVTEEKDFFLNEKEKIKTPYVHSRGTFSYLKLKEMQILDLPFQDGEFSMVFFLPSSDKALAKLEQSIGPESMERWLKDLPEKEVAVSLPKFALDMKLEMTEVMKAMGIIDAFDPNVADFSGMTGKKNLVMSRFDHRTRIALTEAGTEVGEVTLNPASRSPAGVPSFFIADHPFLFGIRSRNPGLFLLLGRVNKPEKPVPAVLPSGTPAAGSK